MDYAVYFLAYCFYTMRPLSAPATLYFPGETVTSHLSWVKGASEIVRAKLSVEMVPGNHITCITQYAFALVDKMKKTLDGFQE